MTLPSLALTARILTQLARSRRTLTLFILFPAAMLVLFGWVGADEMGIGPAFTSAAPGILIGAGLFFSCLGGPVSLLVAERERRTLRRLLAAPLEGHCYLLGVVLAHVAVGFAQVGLVYGLTYAVGGRFEGSILLGILVIALSILAYVGLGVFFGARVARSAEDVNGAVAGIGVPLLVLGGTFFSTEMLPPFLHALAQADPIFHMNEVLKAVARRGAGLEEVIGGLGLLLVLALTSLALGARSYNRMLAAERAA